MSTEKYAKFISEQQKKMESLGLVNLNDRVNNGTDTKFIDELSKKTLGSYIKKATTQKGQHDYAAGKAMGGEDYDDVDHHLDKAEKREKGINKAVKKLTKEEAEFNDIIEAVIDSIAEDLQKILKP